MTSWFEYLENQGEDKTVGEVVPFKKDPELTIEHADASTIVERLELTPELREEFEKAGYSFEEYDHACSDN